MTVYSDLYRYRELFRNLFRRDFQAKYRGSSLGLLWSLLNPLLLTGAYLLVAGVIFDNSLIPHYPLYVLAGIGVWTFFSASLQIGARSLLDSAPLIRKVRFPRQLVPLSVVATQFVTFALMLVLLIVLSLITVPGARGTVWLAIPLGVLFALFVAGVSLIIACLNAIFRDIEHILAAVLLPWFFATPVLWSVATVPSSVQNHHKLLEFLRWGNPVTPPLYAIRAPVWGGELPRAADVIYLCVEVVVALALGALVFSRVDDEIAVDV